MVSRRSADVRTSTGRETDVPERVVAAAFELFAADGYEATTVEAITGRAGVARRTFFRYFRSKDDVIFPDHELLLALAEERLATLGRRAPVAAVCEATTLVFEHYIATPERSLERYRLTRMVPALRAREIASVHAYHRSFTRYLTARFTASTTDGSGSASGSASGSGSGVADAALRAEVAAGAVIAAHNHVLREWLRRGGEGPALPALAEAFDYVTSTFDKAARRGNGRAAAGEAVVVVVRTNDAPEVVAERIRRLV
jgi:AcrR family transcriptional regulator